MVKSYMRRKWLNPAKSYNNGWIKYGIEKDKRVHWSSVEFRLADCTRSIGLDFDVGSSARRKESLEKARILEESIIEFRKSLVELCKEAEKAEADWEKEQKVKGKEEREND